MLSTPRKNLASFSSRNPNRGTKQDSSDQPEKSERIIAEQQRQQQQKQQPAKYTESVCRARERGREEEEQLFTPCARDRTGPVGRDREAKGKKRRTRRTPRNRLYIIKNNYNKYTLGFGLGVLLWSSSSSSVL